MCISMMLTMFGARSKQVDDVEVRPEVTHDLQLWHQRLSLTSPGCSWMRADRKKEKEENSMRREPTEHETLFLFIYFSCQTAQRPVCELNQTASQTKAQWVAALSVSSQENGTGFKIFDSYTGVSRFFTQTAHTACVAYISAFSLPPLCWTGNAWGRKRSPWPPCQRLPIQECDLKHKNKLSGTQRERTPTSDLEIIK